MISTFAKRVKNLAIFINNNYQKITFYYIKMLFFCFIALSHTRIKQTQQKISSCFCYKA